MVSFMTLAAFGQAKVRKMPPNLNHPAINNSAPFISLDGNSMVYLADVAEDNAITMNYTTRQGVNWKDPVILPKSVNNRLNFMKGYSLSADGATLYISNMKSNGMGGFDLYTSQLIGNRWDEPVNMLLPANSKGHEACPSLSLDGSTMFYMRCEKMDFNKADACRILMMKKKPNGQWDTPEELPAFINTGNSQTPRIMADGEILIFSSDQIQPNKGGMDLYVTRFQKGQWGLPQALEFINTAEDDQYVSATNAGMYLLRDAHGQRSSELVEFLFPPDVRPKGTLRVEGIVSGPLDLASPYITIFDYSDQRRVFSTRPGKSGAFVAYMNYGNQYELSVEPEQDNYTFYSKQYDLRGDGSPMVERIQALLAPVSSGDALDLNGIHFDPHSTTVTSSSAQELRRLSRLIHGSPGKSFSIEVTLQGYVQDTIRSTSDLTEVVYDSTRIPVTYVVDSVTTATRDSIVVKARYHNDRTLRQAKAIEAALVQEGTPPARLASSGKAVAEAILEKRNTLVRVIVH